MYIVFFYLCVRAVMEDPFGYKFVCVCVCASTRFSLCVSVT